MGFPILSFFPSLRKVFSFGVLCSFGILLGCTTSPPLSSLPETPSPTPVPSFSIFAVGDSLTEGYRLKNPEKESYPAQLEKALHQEGYSVSIKNMGISGETTAGTRKRAESIRDLHPDIILLFTGSNDALRGVPPEETEKNMEEILRIFTNGEIPVLLISPEAPSSMGEEYQTSFRNVFIRIGKKYNIPIIPFPLEEIIFQEEYVLDDGIHPNAEGYAKMVEKILPHVRSSLQKEIYTFQ